MLGYIVLGGVIGIACTVGVRLGDWVGQKASTWIKENLGPDRWLR